MRPNTAIERAAPSGADARGARVSDAGSARHPHFAALFQRSGAHATRDLADAVHLLSNLYGRHPGLIDMVFATTPPGAAREWLARAAEQFDHERLYLVRLTAAIGPLPSTPGSAQTEGAIQAQRHALETLAHSERPGCALGAVAALVSDWVVLRPLLDRAAMRAGVESPPSLLRDEAWPHRVVGGSIIEAAVARAMAFGGEQLLLQHYALFDLLEARAAARLY